MGALTGRTALVTGASSGIGADIARELARHGANIVLVARRANRLEALATELTALGVTATGVPCDLADPAARVSLAAAQPGIDVLINNAGVGVFGMFADSQWDDVAQMLNVNVVALTHLTHLFAKPMAAGVGPGDDGGFHGGISAGAALCRLRRYKSLCFVTKRCAEC